MTPLRLNMKDTQPVAPMEPPYLSKRCLTSPAVRFLLSVSASTMKAVPPTP